MRVHMKQGLMRGFSFLRLAQLRDLKNRKPSGESDERRNDPATCLKHSLTQSSNED